MNQAIQILDGAIFNLQNQCLQIEAMHEGQVIYCFIAGQDEKTLLSFYSANQFDIEDSLETLIKNDCFDDHGYIQTSIEQLL